jgi:predicted nucleic acid-binding Zn ribbon protein
MLTWSIVAALAVVAVLLVTRRGASPVSLARAAADSQDLSALLQAASALAPARRSAFFHAAIQFLWANWQRPLAASLAREYARQCPDERLCQYWLRQVLEIEPEVARQVFDEPFLAGSYRPEVAKSCCQTSS